MVLMLTLTCTRYCIIIIIVNLNHVAWQTLEVGRLRHSVYQNLSGQPRRILPGCQNVQEPADDIGVAMKVVPRFHVRKQHRWFVKSSVVLTRISRSQWVPVWHSARVSWPHCERKHLPIIIINIMTAAIPVYMAQVLLQPAVLFAKLHSNPLLTI